MPEPVPPYRPGDRVRCVVSTTEDMRGIELLGRIGTVDRATYYDETETPGWDIIVVWDGLLPRMLAHHDPVELAPAGAG
jgi:hypothetical protein